MKAILTLAFALLITSCGKSQPFSIVGVWQVDYGTMGTLTVDYKADNSFIWVVKHSETSGWADTGTYTFDGTTLTTNSNQTTASETIEDQTENSMRSGVWVYRRLK